MRSFRLAFYALCGLYVVAALADFLGPYDEKHTNRSKFNHPPVRIHWRNESGRWTRPFVYNYKLDYATGVYVEDKGEGPYYINLLHRGEPYRLLGLISTNIRLFGVDGPAVVYLLGADHLGRDMLSRLLHGGRRSLYIGLAGILISSIIGMVYGCVAGYCGGRVDAVLMRGVEMLLCIPGMYLVIALGAAIPAQMISSRRYFLIVCILACIGWAGVARVTRGMVLAIRRQEYIEAARAAGAGDWWIMRKHVMPATSAYVVTHMMLMVPGSILSEASLSFLGLGIQEPEASWGNMLSAAMNITAMTSHPWQLAPGAAIGCATILWNLLGDSWRDAQDPRTIHTAWRRQRQPGKPGR